MSKELNEILQQRIQDRLGKTGWLQIQIEHRHTDTKWGKVKKTKTKNEKQKNVHIREPTCEWPTKHFLFN